jgi:hypothetical protein
LVGPRRATLTWDQVVEYAFLAEFDLLRFSQVDIRNEKWAQTTVREMTTKHFKIKSAKDEVAQLNVEIRRLATSIADEGREMPKIICCVRGDQLALSAEIKQQWKLRHAVNMRHLSRLQEIAALPGFSGSLLPGKRQGPRKTVSMDTRANHNMDVSMDRPDVKAELPIVPMVDTEVDIVVDPDVPMELGSDVDAEGDSDLGSDADAEGETDPEYETEGASDDECVRVVTEDLERWDSSLS